MLTGFFYGLSPLDFRSKDNHKLHKEGVEIHINDITLLDMPQGKYKCTDRIKYIPIQSTHQFIPSGIFVFSAYIAIGGTVVLPFGWHPIVLPFFPNLIADNDVRIISCGFEAFNIA